MYVGGDDVWALLARPHRRPPAPPRCSRTPAAARPGCPYGRWWRWAAPRTTACSAATVPRTVVLHGGAVVAAGPVPDTLTPDLLREVFGVAAIAERHADGVVRSTYAARPLAPS
ncbi:hypothetical protein [Streptomyces sp. NPDC000395]|uniref:hypothetical protein n=1 Tax=Streptomyces sp. NPDC000395 TaxID=3154252 RepID=UPI00336A84B9